ncbi:hypothetical protein Plhal304r1_c018g0065191 [Plasmopara halstedii]
MISTDISFRTQISGFNTIEVLGQFKNTRRDPRQLFDATRRCLHLYNVFVGEIMKRGHNNHEQKKSFKKSEHILKNI